MYDQCCDMPTKMAEMTITREMKTNGMVEDLELIV
jgi:hypothetical protein